MGQTALSIGANTFQFFIRNPRGGKVRALDTGDMGALRALMETSGIPIVIAHAPYTLNPCSPKAETRRFAYEAMTDDLARMEHLPHNLYNFHPGSHVGQGADVGVPMIIDHLNRVLTPDQTTTVLLETMAGKGSEVGGLFEELRDILDGVQLQDKVGVCLDVCHVYDAGYDLAGDLDGVLTTFDRIVGLESLRAIHLNDSKNALGSHKDRHAVLGGGTLGLEAIQRIYCHPALSQLPFCLETPNELSGYATEIRLLREICTSRSKVE